MFKNYRFDWWDAFLALLWLLGLCLISFVAMLCIKKKFTHQYSLGSKDGNLTITKEIDWCEDGEIILDRNVSYWDAIRMIDSLNKTLKQ